MFGICTNAPKLLCTGARHSVAAMLADNKVKTTIRIRSESECFKTISPTKIDFNNKYVNTDATKLIEIISHVSIVLKLRVSRFTDCVMQIP
jgi:hypothetical protein